MDVLDVFFCGPSRSQNDELIFGKPTFFVVLYARLYAIGRYRIRTYAPYRSRCTGFEMLFFRFSAKKLRL